MAIYLLYLAFVPRDFTDNLYASQNFFYLKEMTFGKVLEAFKSRFPSGDGGKELYLTDKKSGE